MIYLGHVFSANGVRPDEKKIAAVNDWPTPKDATEVSQCGITRIISVVMVVLAHAPDDY